MKRTLELVALFSTLALATAGTASAHGDGHKAPAPSPTARQHADKPAETSTAGADSSTIEIAGHVAKLERAGNTVTVTITEKDGAPPESATDAKLTIQVGAEKKTVALEGKDGKFTGKVELGDYTKYVAVLQLKLDGKSRTGRFSIDPPVTPAPHEHGAHAH